MNNTEYPFQYTAVEFDFVQDSKGWWTTNARQIVKRSKDNKEWETAQLKIKILDKDFASAIATCWEVFSQANKECDGDLFKHKDSIKAIESNNE